MKTFPTFSHVIKLSIISYRIMLYKEGLGHQSVEVIWVQIKSRCCVVIVQNCTSNWIISLYRVVGDLLFSV